MENINAREFYNNFATNTSEVSRMTGVCRKSLVKLPEGRIMRKDIVYGVLLYLHEHNEGDYKNSIEGCRTEIKSTMLKMRGFLKIYAEREAFLEKLYQIYGLDKPYLVRKETSKGLVSNFLKGE